MDIRCGDYKTVCLKKYLFLFSLIICVGCNSMGFLSGQKNLYGRYYDGALKEKELQNFSKMQSKEYLNKVHETQYKKPYIIGKCVADLVVSNLPERSYQTFADWVIFVSDNKDFLVSAIGRKVVVISEGAINKFNYDQDVLAYFIAHAISHSLLEHDNERLAIANKIKKEDPISYFENDIDDYRKRSFDIVGASLNPDHIQPFNQEMELEASKLALTIISKAGYNPNSVSVFLSKHIDDDELLFFKQHPLKEQTFVKFMELLPEAVGIKQLAESRGRVPKCNTLQ